jgi:hypothetical protein
MAVPYTFGSATTSIPLSQLDSNFATAITLGNTAVQLGNTITSLTGVSNVASATSLSLGSNGNTTAVTIDTSQNVGVGTTSPLGKLAVVSSAGVTSYGSGNSPTLTLHASNRVANLEQQIFTVFTTDTPTIDFGGSIGLGGRSDSASGQANAYAQIAGRKENSTNANYAGYLQFATSDSGGDLFERARINSSGTVILQGGSTSATGVGIAFPATQSASSDANTLDDYEEGTWTPNQGGGLTVVGSFSSSGVYTKIGRVVCIRGVVVGSTSIAAASGAAITTNLPFAPSSDTGGTAFNASLASPTVVDFVSSNIYTTTAIAASPVIFFSTTYQI